MSETPGLHFGPFELQGAQRRLLAHGEPVALGARAFDVLVALAQRRDRVVTKDELLDLVWPDVVVEENNLQVQISALRKLLGMQSIATVPGRGYRFVAPVAAAPASPGTDVSSPPIGRPHTRWPLAVRPLYGREADLEAVVQRLRTHRLVTIVGAGGIGKSRLAEAAAQARQGHWTDGAGMVELSSLEEPRRVPNVVAQTLALHLNGRADALGELIDALRPRSMLLVLDNCEHLLDAVAVLAQAVLDQAPGITMLATSQEPLHLAAEQQYRVLPLAVPGSAGVDGAAGYGAVALFEARVQAVDRHFRLTEERLPLVVDICRRLDGLPLAIEFAAARVATLGLHTVRDKLDARFKLLSGGSRATLRRHQTLRAALEWSHQLLNDDERAVFRRLAVFAGGFSIEMAQHVAGDDRLDDWMVLELLSALVDKSLVVAEHGDPPRYGLLESARAFGLEQLAAGETAEIQRRHAMAVRRLFEQVDRANLDGELRTEQLYERLMPELGNLRVAYAWATCDDGDVTTAILLAACASALEDFATEAAGWLEALLPRLQTALPDPVAAARYWRALASDNMTGQLPLSLQLDAAARAQALYVTLNEPRRAFSSAVQLASFRQLQGDLPGALAGAQAARRLQRADWPAMLRIRLVRLDGRLARAAGRLEDALALFAEEVRIAESTGDWLLEVMARVHVATVLNLQGRLDEAAADIAALVGQLHSRPLLAADDTAWVHAAQISILCASDRIDEAWNAARAHWPALRHTARFDVAMWAVLIWRQGQLHRAATLLGALNAQTARIGMPLSAHDARGVRAMREALQAVMPPQVLASALASGAALGAAEVVALIDEGLAAASLPGP